MTNSNETLEDVEREYENKVAIAKRSKKHVISEWQEYITKLTDLIYLKQMNISRLEEELNDAKYKLQNLMNGE